MVYWQQGLGNELQMDVGSHFVCLSHRDTCTQAGTALAQDPVRFKTQYNDEPAVIGTRHARRLPLTAAVRALTSSYVYQTSAIRQTAKSGHTRKIHRVPVKESL